VLRNLFGASENPIGAEILVKGVALEVVGLLSPRGQSGGGRDQDDEVLLPFSTAGFTAPVTEIARTRSTRAAGAVTKTSAARPRGRVPVFRSRRRVLRLLPRAPRRFARSDRGAPL
jgi:hypothetical protein